MNNHIKTIMFKKIIFCILIINKVLCKNIYIKNCIKEKSNGDVSGWYSFARIDGEYKTRYDSSDPNLLPCSINSCNSTGEVFEWQISDPELSINNNKYICSLKYANKPMECNITDIKISSIDSNLKSCYIYSYFF